MYPPELLYTKDHEWIRMQGDEAYVGVTDFAQSELGDIVYVDMDSAGKSLQKEEVFGTVEAVKTVSDLFMPVSGKVVESNSKLGDQPDLVNKDPYGEGWMMKMIPDDVSQLNELLDAAAYRKLIGM